MYLHYPNIDLSFQTIIIDIKSTRYPRLLKIINRSFRVFFQSDPLLKYRFFKRTLINKNKIYPTPLLSILKVHAIHDSTMIVALMAEGLETMAGPGSGRSGGTKLADTIRSYCPAAVCARFTVLLYTALCASWCFRHRASIQGPRDYQRNPLMALLAFE